jgi:hypothetical protein
MLAKDLQIGQVILVSYVNRNSKDAFERMTVQMDSAGFPVTVTNVRAKALVGKGMLVQVDKGVFRAVNPETPVTLFV